MVTYILIENDYLCQCFEVFFNPYFNEPSVVKKTATHVTVVF